MSHEQECAVMETITQKYAQDKMRFVVLPVEYGVGNVAHGRAGKRYLKIRGNSFGSSG